MSSLKVRCLNPCWSNRLNGDFAGQVICQIATDIYSRDHAELLIASRDADLGETKKVNDVGQERLAVVFHRLIMPDGYAVDFGQEPPDSIKLVRPHYTTKLTTTTSESLGLLSR